MPFRPKAALLQLPWLLRPFPAQPAWHALAGTYAGATAGGTVGAGAIANVLVGGSDRTVALQPVSVQAQTGVNIAAAGHCARTSPGPVMTSSPVN